MTQSQSLKVPSGKPKFDNSRNTVKYTIEASTKAVTAFNCCRSWARVIHDSVRESGIPECVFEKVSLNGNRILKQESWTWGCRLQSISSCSRDSATSWAGRSKNFLMNLMLWKYASHFQLLNRTGLLLNKILALKYGLHSVSTKLDDKSLKNLVYTWNLKI